MKRITRLVIVAGVAGAALAFAGSALAAFTPRIDVSVPNNLGATGTTRVHLAVGPTDDTTARVVSYSPVGFTVNPGTPGQTIGDVDARVRAGDLGGAIVPVTGTIEVRPADGTALVSGVPVPLAALATGCTGTATHTAFWVFKLSAAGQSLELATFYDTTTGAEAALGSSKLTFCLPPDDVPAGTPGRSPLGIKLVDALLVYKNVYTNPSSAGAYVWTSFWTPYNPGVGTANAAGTVTAISLNGLPVAATLKGGYVKKTKSARLVGRISAAGQFQAGVRLPLFAGTAKAKLKRSGSTGPTAANGAFTAVKRIVKATFFQVRFAVPVVDVTSTACAAVPATLPRCVSATVGAFAALTNIVKVTPRR
jgi:hypothetical protein